MVLTPYEFISQKISYESFYHEYHPQTERCSAITVHDLVGEIIEAQLSIVNDFDDLSSAKNELDRFIRKLKVKFNCVNVDLNKFK